MKIYFCASRQPRAQALLKGLTQAYPPTPLPQAEVVVAIGGDGFMLHTLHKMPPVPVFGVHAGRVGFLMNGWNGGKSLVAQIEEASAYRLSPLRMEAEQASGNKVTAHAFNEVSFLRARSQAAKMSILINGQKRLSELIGDGVLLATPAGSTAYNLSAHGPIVPIGTPLLALTPLNPFRPRRWRGALLPDNAQVEFLALEHKKRPVNVVADYFEVPNVVRVTVQKEDAVAATLLFAATHNLEERILREQFF